MGWPSANKAGFGPKGAAENPYFANTAEVNE
jgi:hypothetical protein